ncbi:MAG: hypothetical protein Q9162_003513 [Coniocarpon cinnabarinum]
MAVGMGEREITSYLEGDSTRLHQPDLVIACVNSPQSVTVAGAESQVGALKAVLDGKGIFTRLLPVAVAYHSPQMLNISEKYKSLIGDYISQKDPASCQHVRMFSSVTGAEISADEVCTARYWTRNLTSPVRFSDAVQGIMDCLASDSDPKKPIAKRAGLPRFVEVGPHAALKGPLQDIIAHGFPSEKLQYVSFMKRDVSAIHTFLEAVGQLHCWGQKVHLDVVAEQCGISQPRKGKILTNLPPYPFNHAQSYWHESRLNRGVRFQSAPRLPLLGTPAPDWNPLQPKWRNILRMSELGWVQDHKINGTVIVPGAGMLVCAIEAAKQLRNKDRTLSGFRITDVDFQNWLTIGPDDSETETNFFLMPNAGRSTLNCPRFDFKLTSLQGERWIENCHGSIQIEYEEAHCADHVANEGAELQSELQDMSNSLTGECDSCVDPNKFYSSMSSWGFAYGPAFQLLTNMRTNSETSAIADVQGSRFNVPEHMHCPTSFSIHPATFDCLLQLSFVGWTNGGKNPVATAVPRRIQHVWLSEPGLSLLGDLPLRACAFGQPRSHDSRIAAFHPSTRRLVALVEDVTLAKTSNATHGEVDLQSKLLAYQKVMKPDITLLTQEELLSYCSNFCRSAGSQFETFVDIHRVILGAMWQAVQHFEAEKSVPHSKHLQRYFSWIQNLTQRIDKGYLDNFNTEWLAFPRNVDELSASIQQLNESRDPRGKLYATIAEKLIPILEGQTNVHELLFTGSLARDFYRETATEANCNSAAARFIDLLAHKNPQLSVLEIGAGTGGFTATAMQALSGNNQAVDTKNRRWSRFDFTDISQSFFSDAKTRFGGQENRVGFKILDIEADIETQGFEAASYDLILAASVLHATKDLAVTLGNVRRLLKPGGVLLMVEVTETDKLAIPFAWGLLEGWWRSTDGRGNGPCIDTQQWSDLLKSTGFSGADLAFADHDDPRCREISVIVSKAAGASVPIIKPDDIKIIIDSDVATQRSLAENIKSRPELCRHRSCEIATLQDVAASTNASTDLHCISLLDVDRPFFATFNEHDFHHIKVLIQRARMILWITRSRKDDQAPFHIVDGLARVLRSERSIRLDFVTIALASSMNDCDHVWKIAKIWDKNFSRNGARDFERELEESAGLIHIPRVEPNNMLSDAMREAYRATQSTAAEFGSGSPLRMAIESPGSLDTITFTEEVDCRQPLQREDVEIEVKAVGLNFRDVLAALGKIDLEIGFEAAGVVTQACPSSKLMPGDRVAGFTRSAFRSRARCDYRWLVKVPDNMSYSAAASVPCCFATAYHSLVNVAQLKAGDTILIHAAAGGTGQAAIQIARWRGAEIYATVGSMRKKMVLINEYGVPEQNIFNSRDLSFASGVMRMTSRKGVDVVLNSLSGQALVESFKCVAAFGRFIEIGKSDIFSNASMPMKPLANNVSFCCVDLTQLVEHRPATLQDTMVKVWTLFAEGKLEICKPVTTFPIPEVEDAFRSMQSGNSLGKLVVELGSDHKVSIKVSKMATWKLDSDATYLVAGAFGGLGRNLARWLANRGARHLLLLSRQGARTSEARALLQELTNKSVDACAPMCDISDADELKRVLGVCTATMPPIKGCIQSSLVLQDSLFDNMSYDGWKVPLNAKIHGSWNLHRQLPSGLQHFVMLSSSVGMVGNPGQANYAAANTYQDALAHQRVSQGERALAVDLPLMIETDSFSVKVEAAERLKSVAKIATMSPSQLYALLDYCCDPTTELPSHTQCQPILGIIPPAELESRGLEPHEYLYEPSWRPLWNIEPDGKLNESSSDSTDENFADKFRATSTLDEAADILVYAMLKKVARSLAIPEQDVDVEQPMNTYGVDSLVGVELRNWLHRTFDTELAVFDILGGATFAAVGRLAAERSKLR